jgi:hypothetical protein
VTDLKDGVNMELRDVNKGLQAEIKELKDKQGKSMMERVSQKGKNV